MTNYLNNNSKLTQELLSKQLHIDVKNYIPICKNEIFRLLL